MNIILKRFRYASLAGDDDGICESVPKVVDMKQAIAITDQNRGIWSTDPNFVTNSTAYSVTLGNYVGSSAEFMSFLTSTESKLEALGAKASSRSLPWNLIAWTTFSHQLYGGQGSYTFQLEGDVDTVFRKPYISGCAATKGEGLCEADYTQVLYVPGSSSMFMNINDYFTTDGNKNGKCLNSFNAENFGISNASISLVYSNLRLMFDMRSISVALAVNLGHIPLSELSRVPTKGLDEFYPFNYCSSTAEACSALEIVDWGSFYAQRYYGMTPIVCIEVVGEDQTHGDYCFLRVGNMLLIPSIHHLKSCDCTDVTNNDDTRDECNKQNILTGLFYYADETYDAFPKTLDVATALIRGILDNPGNDDYWNQLTYDLALAISNRALDVNEKFDEVCPDEQCSMVVITTEEGYDSTAAINGYSFQLANGACTDSFYSESSFTDLKRSIPFEFNERYKKCKLRWEDNWVNSVGISTGNASIMTQMFMFAVTFVIGQVLKHFFQYSTGFGSSDYAKELEKTREKAQTDGETFSEWFNRIVKNQRHEKDIVDDTDSDDDFDVKAAVKHLNKQQKQNNHHVDSILLQLESSGMIDHVDELSERLEIFKNQRANIDALKTKNARVEAVSILYYLSLILPGPC